MCICMHIVSVLSSAQARKQNVNHKTASTSNKISFTFFFFFSNSMSPVSRYVHLYTHSTSYLFEPHKVNDRTVGQRILSVMPNDASYYKPNERIIVEWKNNIAPFSIAGTREYWSNSFSPFNRKLLFEFINNTKRSIIWCVWFFAIDIICEARCISWIILRTLQCMLKSAFVVQNCREISECL